MLGGLILCLCYVIVALIGAVCGYVAVLNLTR